MRPPFGTFSVKQLVPGCEGVHVGRIKLATNTAVWAYRLGDVMIDTGPPNQWHKIHKYLQQAPSLRAVAVTHHHEDHAGNIARLWHTYRGQNRPLELYAPASSMSKLHDGFDIEWYRALIWGHYHQSLAKIPLQPLPERIPATLDDGTTVHIQPIAAPGHCADHTVMYVPEKKWLFCADLYVTSKPKMAFYDEKPLVSINTLRALCRGTGRDGSPLDVDVMFCAHRGMLKDGMKRLNERLEWLESLRDSAHHMYSKVGVRDLRQISLKLLGRENEVVHYASRGDFSRLHLIRGLLDDVIPRTPDTTA